MSGRHKGPKKTASGWPHVYNLRSRHGRDRFYFWSGRQGEPQIRVANNEIAGPGFLAAYARFEAGQHPYLHRPLLPPRTPADDASILYGTDLGGEPSYAYGTVGWLILEHIQTTKFQRQKNRRAIEGQLRWVRTQPIKRSNPAGATVGTLPLERFDTFAIGALVDRKVTAQLIERRDRSGRASVVEVISGAAQQRNLLKWLSAVMKTGIKLKLLRSNPTRDVERAEMASGGYRMWTDDIWERVFAHYPPGTKPHLVFSLAGYTSQRRGDVTFLGSADYLAPEEGLPYGSFEVEQEKGDDGQPFVAYIPIVDELHEAIEAARQSGILGSKYFIRQDKRDEPYTKESLGNMVRAWLAAIGISGYSLHGLRKLCVCRLIERGCTPHEVMSITGHETLKEIDRYAKAYFRRKNKATVYAKWRKSMERERIRDARVAELSRRSA